MWSFLWAFTFERDDDVENNDERTNTRSNVTRRGRNIGLLCIVFVFGDVLFFFSLFVLIKKKYFENSVMKQEKKEQKKH